ncbi:YnfU family zinc-binding protein [Acerihabitans sp.]|uniref:YnfU family zinc-binding protein n=1 Tax=Acerihabitans sp. TaxID=2811394 RepID=UPI002EDB98D6
MSIFDALKAFGSTSVKVTCPECGFATQQPALKVRKNITLVCPKCGHYFLPKDK